VPEKTESQDRWERSPGFLYFIAASDPPIAIKIGISTQRDVRRRFSTIQGANHEPLFLLGVIPFAQGERPMLDAQRKEAELHVRFAQPQRFREGWAGSEWFTPAPELMAFISEVALLPLSTASSHPSPSRGRVDLAPANTRLEPPARIGNVLRLLAGRRPGRGLTRGAASERYSEVRGGRRLSRKPLGRSKRGVRPSVAFHFSS